MATALEQKIGHGNAGLVPWSGHYAVVSGVEPILQSPPGNIDGAHRSQTQAISMPQISGNASAEGGRPIDANCPGSQTIRDFAVRLFLAAASTSTTNAAGASKKKLKNHPADGAVLRFSEPQLPALRYCSSTE